MLDRLDLPGQSPYATGRVALLNSPSKIGILIDSSMGYLSGRMRLLQTNLAGKNRTILHRDPVAQRDAFAAALGGRSGGVALWEFPVLVETLLFTKAEFVEASLRALFLFDPKFPLLQARMKQLRGEVADAKLDYVSFRLAEKLTLPDKKTPIPKEVQRALDIYATYYLGLCNLDQGDAEQRREVLPPDAGDAPRAGRRPPLLSHVPMGCPGEPRPPVRSPGRPGPRLRVLRAGRPHLAAPRQPAPRPRPDLARPGLAPASPLAPRAPGPLGATNGLRPETLRGDPGRGGPGFRRMGTAHRPHRRPRKDGGLCPPPASVVLAFQGRL